MKTQKKHQFDKLQKSSIVFTQLGLVLALVVVYLALEFTAVKKNFVLDESPNTDEPTIFDVTIRDIIIERKANPQEKQQETKKKFALNDDFTTTEDPDIEEPLFDQPIENDPPVISIDSIIEAPPIVDEDPLPFILIENAPIFPGCEGLEKQQSKQCFTQKITKFVNKRFDTSLAEESNIKGKQRIFVEFTIDKTGKVVDIKAKSPYKNLEKEAIRVVKKLPQMTPGKQRTRSVGVKYTLPIIFEVY